MCYDFGACQTEKRERSREREGGGRLVASICRCVCVWWGVSLDLIGDWGPCETSHTRAVGVISPRGPRPEDPGRRARGLSVCGHTAACVELWLRGRWLLVLWWCCFFFFNALFKWEMHFKRREAAKVCGNQLLRGKATEVQYVPVPGGGSFVETACHLLVDSGMTHWRRSLHTMCFMADVQFLRANKKESMYNHHCILHSHTLSNILSYFWIFFGGYDIEFKIFFLQIHFTHFCFSTYSYIFPHANSTCKQTRCICHQRCNCGCKVA